MRKSNYELLRLISMFFVLVLHANYLSIDAPIYMEVSAPEFAIRHFIESFTFIAVDVFILISGYFSIRPSISFVMSLGAASPGISTEPMTTSTVGSS